MLQRGDPNRTAERGNGLFLMIFGPKFAQRFVSPELPEEEVIVKWGLKENAHF